MGWQAREISKKFGHDHSNTNKSHKSSSRVRRRSGGQRSAAPAPFSLKLEAIVAYAPCSQPMSRKPARVSLAPTRKMDCKRLSSSTQLRRTNIFTRTSCGSRLACAALLAVIKSSSGSVTGLPGAPINHHHCLKRSRSASRCDVEASALLCPKQTGSRFQRFGAPINPTQPYGVTAGARQR